MCLSFCLPTPVPLRRAIPLNKKREELYTAHLNVVSPNTRLTNELNKHPTLVLYVCDICGRKDTYNQRKHHTVPSLSVEILAIFV